MKWINIKHLSPNTPRQVLLYTFDSEYGICHHTIAELGGCKNAPEITIISEDGRVYARKATHWCELDSP